MEKIRQDLITIAASPETDLGAIQLGLAAVRKEEEPSQKKAGFLSEKEALQFAGHITRSTLWGWGQNGLRSYKVNGRRLFDPDDIREFITSQPKEINKETV